MYVDKTFIIKLFWFLNFKVPNIFIIHLGHFQQ